MWLSYHTYIGIIHPSISPFIIHPLTHLLVHPLIYLCIHMSIHPFIPLLSYPFVHPPIHPPVHLSHPSYSPPWIGPSLVFDLHNPFPWLRAFLTISHTQNNFPPLLCSYRFYFFFLHWAQIAHFLWSFVSYCIILNKRNLTLDWMLYSEYKNTQRPREGLGW